MNPRIVAIAAAVIAVMLLIWASGSSDGPPEGFAVANGRVEAERMDVSSKFAGRIDEILVEEGAYVTKGETVARLDDAEISATLREAEASAEEARRTVDQAKALLSQRQSELVYARQELERAETLVGRDFATRETVDLRRSQELAAQAAVSAAEAEIARAEAAIDAAEARVERLKTNLADHTLTAPQDARVQYKLASIGEVVAAGGRVLTLLDLTDVYMTVFLSTGDAGRLLIGDEARIVLDAAPEYVIPAEVSFVAAEAQFTPKYVETEDERRKLTFRVKVRIPAELLLRYRRVVKTGLPGVAYVRTDPDAVWPDWLAPKLPEPPDAPPAAPAALSSGAESAG